MFFQPLGGIGWKSLTLPFNIKGAVPTRGMSQCQQKLH